MDTEDRITLTFVRSYKSITELAEVRLPRFTLLTGHNGVGKTQLLEAIKEGHVRLDPAVVKGAAPVLYEMSNFRASAGDYDARDKMNQWISDVPKLVAAIASARAATVKALRDAGATSLDDTAEGLVKLYSDDPTNTAFKVGADRLTSALGSAKVTAGSSVVLANIARATKKPIIALEELDLQSPIWGQRGVVESNIAEVFVNYRDARLRNLTLRAAKMEGRHDVFPLSEEQFRSKFGEPPWSVIDRNLRRMGLPFSITRPREFEYAKYHPYLMRAADSKVIPFSDLSSGEKILLNLSIASYNSVDVRTAPALVPAILLDEVDAPLHPSMARQFVETVEKEIVHGRGIPVICSTHSMSTVALAPDSSVFVMHTDPPRLEWVGRGKALAILSYGVPTLSLDYEGRRQVMVESQADAKVYGVVYELLKRDLASEISLEFIGVGTKSTSTGTDVMSGRDVVIRLVNDLSSGGVRSVLGVIDWDGENSSSGKIFVLSERVRDGLENLVLDPLLVAGLLIRLDAENGSLLGLPAHTSYRQFLELTAKDLQPVVDAFQARVLEAPIGRTTAVKYVGDVSLQIAIDYLQMDDHALEEAIWRAFPPLKKLGSHRGDLMLYVAKNLLNDQRNFIPRDALLLFQALLAA